MTVTYYAAETISCTLRLGTCFLCQFHKSYPTCRLPYHLFSSIHKSNHNHPAQYNANFLSYSYRTTALRSASLLIKVSQLPKLNFNSSTVYNLSQLHNHTAFIPDSQMINKCRNSRMWQKNTTVLHSFSFQQTSSNWKFYFQHWRSYELHSHAHTASSHDHRVPLLHPFHSFPLYVSHNITIN